MRMAGKLQKKQFEVTWTHEDTFESPHDTHHENGKIDSDACGSHRKPSHMYYMCGRLSLALLEHTIRTWAKPLPRATPCIFLQPEIYKKGVSIAKHILCI